MGRQARLCPVHLLLVLAFAGLALSPLPLHGAPQPALRAPVSGLADGHAWRLDVSPEKPAPGDHLIVELRVEGLSGAEPDIQEFSRGLSLVSMLTRPYSEKAKGKTSTGSLVSLEFLVGGEGPWSIDRLALRGREGSFSLPRVDFDLSKAQAAAAALPPSWRWAAPERVYRFESFGLSIEGAGLDPGRAVAIFEAPAGTAMESHSGSYLAWTVTALETGSLVLPEATVDSGGRTAQVPPRRVEVLPLPSELLASRAIGDFALEATGPASARAGDPVSFSLVLSGRGNLPSVRFPAYSVSIDGKALPASALSERRYDEVSPMAEGYEGRSVLEISLAAPKGRLRLRFDPLPVLGPSGSVTRLEVPPLLLEVAQSAAGGATAGDPFSAILADPRLSANAALATSARAWKAGERGKALAALYGLSRRSPGDKRLSVLADAAESAVAAGPRVEDGLPPPLPLAAASLGGAILGLLLLVLAFRPKGRRPERRAKRRRERLRRPRLRSPGLAGGGSFLLVAALALAVLAAASAGERRREFAVAWTDKALAVPSPLSENLTAITRGQSGLVVGKAEGYKCLRFQDGSVGWVPLESVYSY